MALAQYQKLYVAWCITLRCNQRPIDRERWMEVELNRSLPRLHRSLAAQTLDLMHWNMGERDEATDVSRLYPTCRKGQLKGSQKESYLKPASNAHYCLLFSLHCGTSTIITYSIN
jgi:hypothetical protein